MTSPNEIVESETAERGIPGASVRKKSRLRAVWLLLAVALTIAAAAAFAIVALNRFTAQKAVEKADAKKAGAEHAGNGQASDLSSMQARIAAAEKAAKAAADTSNANTPAPASVTGASSVTSVSATRTGSGAGGVVVPAISALEQRRYGGDVTVDAASGVKATAVDATQSTLDALKDAVKGGPVTVNAKKNSLEEQLTPSTVEVGHAALLPDLDYLLERGTLIPCGVVTKIVTTYPGAVVCTVLRDVYSANGHTVLIRAGARAFGEQRTGLTQGQTRIMVLWDSIDDGKVEITLNSPAADSLGGSGIEAYVDNHFLDRFGGAIMVSLIGDFGQALANKSVGSGNNQISFSNSSNATQNAAEEVLKTTINIPPTAYTNQGAVTNIFVARHVDLHNVYELVNDE